MRIPVLAGIIKRRLLVNFQADPDVVQKLLPAPFRPRLQSGRAVVGICLIRLEHERPAALPEFLGLASENAAHRIAVEWGDQTGVFIPRRDTNSQLNRLVGGRLFAGEQHAASFQVHDEGGHIELSLESEDGEVSLRVIGEETGEFPSDSCFGSLAEASAFFEEGDRGFSPRGDGGVEGMRLETIDWRVSPLRVSEVRSSYFEKFPAGSVRFDHALVMRDIRHEWHEIDSPSL